MRVPASEVPTTAPSMVVVTYGNGVPHALKAIQQSGLACDVIDCPLLSRCPAALPPLLRARGYAALMLVDVCREGGGPLPHLASHLHQAGALPSRWTLLSAAPTYNPLGRTLTFISADKIGTALTRFAGAATLEASTPLSSPSPPSPPSPPAPPAPLAADHAVQRPVQRPAANRAHDSAPPRGTRRAPKSALVICPGRGSYNAAELGSLNRLAHPELWQPIVAEADAACTAAGLRSVSELDSAPNFDRSAHMDPAHSSALTYTIAAADFASRFGRGTGGDHSPTSLKPVGLCGNSLGWYTAVALGGSVSFGGGLDVVLTTSRFQRSEPQVGGQLVYPTLGAEWEESAELSAAIEDALAAANRPGVGYASVSIELGRATVLDH